MTETEFLERIERNLKGIHFFSVGPCLGCLTCFPDAEDPENPTESDYDGASEGGFSWSRCESCGSNLGGQRYPAHGVIADSPEQAQQDDHPIEHFEVCSDCLFFHANGDLPEFEPSD